MAKIEHDKYYTSTELAEYTVSKTMEIVGKENISQWVEPSAGSGVFLDILNRTSIPYKAYDILPEDERILKGDFLKVNWMRKKGVVTIGNPPYALNGSTTYYKRFIKKGIQLGYYVAFILPSSCFKKNNIKKARLIYTEDLGEQWFYDRYIKVCFNIYKHDQGFKPINYIDETIFKLDEYHRTNRKIEEPKNYDLTIIIFGSVGIRKLKHNEICHYYYITITDLERKDEILKAFNETDWINEINYMGCHGGISSGEIYKIIKLKLGDIEEEDFQIVERGGGFEINRAVQGSITLSCK